MDFVRSVRSLRVAVALLAVAPAVAEPPLYTNADLERYGAPTATPPAPVAPDPGAGEGWKFVADHLAREYQRIEAERDARWAEAQVVATGEEPVYGCAAPWLSHACGLRWSAPSCHPPRRHHRGFRPPTAEQAGRIPPLHARGPIVPLHARGRIAPLPTTRGEDSFPRRGRASR
jgi:hypothetical protein